MRHAAPVMHRLAPDLTWSAVRQLQRPQRPAPHTCLSPGQVIIYLLGPILAAVVPFVLVGILFTVRKLHGYCRGTADTVIAKRCEGLGRLCV